MSFQVRQIKAERKPRASSALARRLLMLGMTLWKPLSGWYQAWKQRQEREERHHKRVVVLKRVLAVLFSLLIATALLAAIAQTLFSVKFSLRQLLSAAGTELAVDENGHFNVLLLGTGDDDHEGKDLADTIIVASIDTKSQVVAMLSLPRDLYFLETDQMGKGRINSLYRDYKGYLRAQGKGEDEASKESLLMLKDEVGRKLGINIQHVIKVNFTAFEEGVNLIGGIDIDVPKDIVDPEYPGPNYSYQTFTISAGPHHLDGATALQYARSRHSTSDFDRSARQQQIIAAAIAKAREMKLHKDIGKLTEMYHILSKNVEMTLTIGELITLASTAEDFGTEHLVTMQLNDQSGIFGGFIAPGGFLYAPPREQFGGASVLLPASIPEYPITWTQLQTLTKLLFQHRALYVKPVPRIAVLNAGAPEGAARLLGGELLRYGFDIVEIDNNPGGKLDTSSITSRPPAPDQKGDPLELHRTFLGKLLSLTESPYPAGIQIDGSPDILIILGKDFSYHPLKDLPLP